jgi:pimeloyl-ACP methyl ester carboxylesterase
MRGRPAAATLLVMPSVATNTIELRSELTGSGETVVLVHGGWSDRNNWRPVVPGLAESFEVVAVDRRGHGLSARGVQGTRRDQEDDLAALIESLSSEPVNLVGTSFGGSIAIGLASRRPELVRALIAHEPPLIGLVAGNPDVGPELQLVQASMGAVLARIDEGDAEGAARQFVEEIALGPGSWEALPPPLRATMVDSAPALILEQMDEDWADIDRAALAGIDGPVLLTQGDQSPAWFRSIVAELSKAIEGAEVHTYRGAGHAPHLTHSTAWLNHVKDSLTAKELTDETP